MSLDYNIHLALLSNRLEISDVEKLTPEEGDFFVSEAVRHRIAPLLYHKIKSAGSGPMFPTDVVHKLRRKYLANAYRNTVLFHRLTELAARLNNKGIPVVLLKGAHLAAFIYGDISLRPMSDLDILVREEHLSEAVQVAFNAGYRFFYDKKNATEKSGERYCYDISEYYKHFQPLIHPEARTLLEIHCYISDVGNAFDIPATELWERAQPADLNGNSVFILSPEDLVIHLCLHAAYDHLFGFGMSALYDIAVTINHYRDVIDWKEVLQRSGRWRTRRCLLLALYFTKKWMGADIPNELFGNFPIDHMVQLAEERIFKASETTPLHPHYIQWRNIRGMGGRIRYMLNVLFPSREFMANRYLRPKHSQVLFGSYFFRIFQALKGACAIAITVLHSGRYISRLKAGDSDFRLREWLAKSS